MLVKLIGFFVLFSLVYCGNDATCCDIDVLLGPDIAWFVYAPPDVSIQCHLALGLTYAQNIDPNFTGWGWEIYGCGISKAIVCPGQGTWCDDGGPGGGLNEVLDDYDDDFVDGCGITRVYTRTWYSISTCPATALAATQTISLVDTIAPTLAIPYDLEYECPPQLPNINSISEMNNYFGSPDVIDFCRSFTDNDIAQSATISAAGQIDRSFFISDGCNDSSGLQRITLVDTTPPVLERLPNVYQECDVIVDSTPPFARDTCYRSDVALTVTPNDVTYAGICAGKYSIVRTWTATDLDGNSVRETQIIVVDDTTPPVIDPIPASTVVLRSVDCFSDIVFPYTQDDTCSAVGTVNVPYDISLSHNEDEGRTEVLVTYTSSDDCGNSEQWADLWQINSGIGLFSDVISGPTSLVDKGVPFEIIIEITTTNDCIPFGILLVDSGYATLQPLSDSCFFQAASGVIYCDPVPTVPGQLILNLAVPADYLGDNVLISISWHYNYRTTAVILGSYLVSFNP